MPKNTCLAETRKTQPLNNSSRRATKKTAAGFRKWGFVLHSAQTQTKVERRIVYGCEMSVVVVASEEYLLGTQFARRVDGQVFNVYRSMRNKGIELKNACKEQVRFLVRTKHLERSARSAKLLPLNACLQVLFEKERKRLHHSEADKEKQKRSVAYRWHNFCSGVDLGECAENVQGGACFAKPRANGVVASGQQGRCGLQNLISCFSRFAFRPGSPENNPFSSDAKQRPRRCLFFLERDAHTSWQVNQLNRGFRPPTSNFSVHNGSSFQAAETDGVATENARREEDCALLCAPRFPRESGTASPFFGGHLLAASAEVARNPVTARPFLHHHSSSKPTTKQVFASALEPLAPNTAAHCA